MLRQMAAAVAAATAVNLTADEQRDILTYLHSLLEEINQTVYQTIEAWEKRGYWVKADRFRMEWSWVERAIADLSIALEANDLTTAPATLALVAQNLSDVKPYVKDSQAKPWRGSWERQA